MERENDIILDSKYLIKMYNNDNKEVTNLLIQKLMFFFEAFLMCELDKDEIYECKFLAWNYGPVAIPLYGTFETFGKEPIILGEEIDLENNKKKKLMTEFYNAFKEIDVWRLVYLTHREDSPWYEVWIRNNKRPMSDERGQISKQKTKEWFGKNFLSE